MMESTPLRLAASAKPALRAASTDPADESKRRWRLDAAHAGGGRSEPPATEAERAELRLRLLRMIVHNEQVRRNDERASQR